MKEPKVEIKEEDNVKENKQRNYRDYKKVIIKARTKRPVLGTDAATSDVCVKHNVKQLNILPRNEKGDIRFKPWWFRAGLRDTSSIFNTPKQLATDWIRNYDCSVSNGKKVEVSVVTLALHPENKGVISNYEVLPEGIEFELSFFATMIANRNPVSKATYKEWVSMMLNEGIGSIRKGEWGACELTDIKFIDI